MSVTDADLLAAARNVRERAHAPYSGYLVGAAVLDERDRVHVGCNVENASFPEGCCAETGAIAAMVAAGGLRIRAIAVVGAAADGSTAKPAICTPCGGCRQRIGEFADAATRILVVDAAGAVQSLGMDDLLPGAFRIAP